MNTKYFKDDNAQRAREITSPRPTNVPFNRDKQYFTPEERRAILTRVKAIGVFRTAVEFGIDKKIIMRWLDDMDLPKDSTLDEINESTNENKDDVYPSTVTTQNGTDILNDTKEINNDNSHEQETINKTHEHISQDVPIEIENAILKEKIVQLTEHINKLKALIKILS